MPSATQQVELALNVKLSRQASERLSQQALSVGRGIDEYVSDVLEHAALSPDLDSLLAPIRKEFADSGATDEQLIGQINEAREEYRASQHKASA